MSESSRRPTRPSPPTVDSTESELVRTEEVPQAPLEIEEFLEDVPPPIGQRRRQRLVLVGAGHAHLQVLNWWSDRPIPGVELVLVSAFPYAVYSGMVPSVLAGLLPEKEMLVDLAKLTRRSGAELLIDKVVGLDPVTRTLELAHHPEQSFDVASINIGSANLREDLCQTHRSIVAVKPLATFLGRLELRLQELLTQWKQAPGPEYLQLAVVGGGAAGIEIALCLEERAHREGWHAQVQVIDAGSEILPGYSPRAVRLVRKLCKQRSIEILSGATVAACDEDGPTELVFDTGGRHRVDLVIWAAGAAPPGHLRGYQLPLSDRGYLAVRPTLQSTADAPVFAAGDIADIVDCPCPKAGVYSVRQGPVLWENLRQWFRCGEPVEYQPQEKFLSLLSCGDGTAILDYKGWSLRSSWMWLLKKSIDRRFVRRFQ